MSITVLVPTRQRPQQAFLTYESFKNTVAEADTNIIFGIDSDEAAPYKDFIPGHSLFRAHPQGSGSFQKVTNTLAVNFGGSILGSVGDDHRFKTKGWDSRVTESLLVPGIAYANDLYQRDILPTAAFISREVYDALGLLALPVCDHLYIDNAWKDIGLGIDSLHYLPDVIIEHLHYTNGKNQIDANYRRTNSVTQFDKDGKAYLEWARWQKHLDIERVKDALNERNRTTS
jgi:hypothetical protein